MRVTGVSEPMPGVVYPDPERLRKYVESGALGTQTLGQVFHSAATRFASRVAIRRSDTGRHYTYAELDDLSARFGAALLDLGLAPRDRVIFQIGNVEELFFCLHGCFKAGLIPIATLPSHREQEIGFLARHTAARAHIVQADFRRGELPEFAREMARQYSSLEHLITVRGHVPGMTSFEDLVLCQTVADARRRLDALRIDPFDVAIFQLSGGTTGVPKVIPRFHNEYLYNMQQWAVASAYDRDTVAYWPLPIIHNAGLVCGAGPVHLYGGSVVLQDSLEPQAMLEAIQRERVTFLAATIPLIVRMLDSGIVSHYDLSSLRDFISAGEAELVEREFCVPGHHLFGMSEGLCMRTRPEHPSEARMKTVGTPLSSLDEIRLLAPGSDVEVPEGEVGELCCRGPYTIRGYYRAEDHNRRAFTVDGFYRSGDLMRAHRVAGTIYYSFEGRIKDNIDRGGEKINAEEVERLIIEHPAVREVAVIGIPDREFGERVCACIIPKAPATVPDVESLRAFLTTRGLAKYKCPERVEIVATFPVTRVGKVSKPDLRRETTARMAGAVITSAN